MKEISWKIRRRCDDNIKIASEIIKSRKAWRGLCLILLSIEMSGGSVTLINIYIYIILYYVIYILILYNNIYYIILYNIY